MNYAKFEKLTFREQFCLWWRVKDYGQFLGKKFLPDFQLRKVKVIKYDKDIYYVDDYFGILEIEEHNPNNIFPFIETKL